MRREFLASEIKAVELNIQEAKNLARKTEGLVLAITLVAWMLFDLPNLIGAIAVVAGYLITNGVLTINLSKLKKKLKELKDKI